MPRQSHFLRLLLLLLLHLRPAFSSCPTILSPQTRIVGGTPAPLSTASFTASLLQAFASSCTGSLLSPTWVLTARHCLPTNATFVFLSSTHRSSGPLISVRSVHMPPGDDPRDDIALLRLAHSAPSNATFIKINANPSLPRASAFVRAAGYGLTAFAGPPTRLLRQVDAPAVAPAACRTAYPNDAHSALDHRTLCAGYSHGRCGVCSGDSGGPLLQYDPAGLPVQVGIVSRSRGCAWRDTPAIFTRLSAFVPWMREVGADFQVAEDALQVMDDGALAQGEGADGQQQQKSGDGDGDGLAPWAIGLVAGGPLLACIVLAAAVAFFARRRRGNNSNSAETGHAEHIDLGEEGGEEEKTAEEGIEAVPAEHGGGP